MNLRPETTSPGAERGWQWGLPVLTLLTVLVYYPVVGHDFVSFDDGLFVTGNRHVLSGLSLESLRWSLTATEAANWFPLTWISHLIDVQLFGLNAGGHHFTNLILHLLNVLLLFTVLKSMTGSPERSFWVAALFAVHPLHVESVAWVAQRRDVLSGLFALLTLWSYQRYTVAPRWRSYALVLALFGAGLMAKPMLVTLPFVLLLLDYWPLQRAGAGAGQGSPARPAATGGWLRLVAEKTPFFVLSGLVSAATYLAQERWGTVSNLAKYTLGERLLNVPAAYGEYLAKTFWPRHLAAFYPRAAEPSVWKGAAAAAVLTALAVAAFRYRRRLPYLLVGGGMFLGMLVPVIGLVQVGEQSVADRYTYLPHIGLFIAVVWGICDLAPRSQAAKVRTRAIGAVLVLSLSMAAHRQVGFWRDSRSLFSHAAAVTRDNWMAEYNLGVVLEEEGRLDEALRRYEAAFRIRPWDAEARNNAGAVLIKMGRDAEAEPRVLEALQLEPDLLEAWYNLGLLRERSGNRAGAVNPYRQVLRLSPGHPEAGAALARVRSRRPKERAEETPSARQHPD